MDRIAPRLLALKLKSPNHDSFSYYYFLTNLQWYGPLQRNQGKSIVDLIALTHSRAILAVTAIGKNLRNQH